MRQQVESLNRDLNDANERTRATQKEKEEKEAEIADLNRRMEAALEASRVIQERQTEQENVIAFQACHVDRFAGEDGTCAGGAAEHCAADGEEDVGGVAVVARCEDCGAGDARGRTDGEGGGPDAGAEGRCGRELRRRR